MKQSGNGSKKKTIDWAALHARIAGAQAALERESAPDAGETARILHVRALTLAAEPPAEPGESMDIVAFRLAGETYGIESRWVREICPLKGYTTLPGTPPFVLGIVNLRGQVLSVIDLKRLFELPLQGLGDLNRVLVLRSQEMEFGVLADAVIGVRPVLVGALTPGLPTLTGNRAQYLKGITPEGEIILDGEKLLADPQLVIHD